MNTAPLLGTLGKSIGPGRLQLHVSGLVPAWLSGGSLNILIYIWSLYYMFLWMFLWMFFSPLVGINPNNLTFHVLLSWYAFAGTDNLFHWQSLYFGLWTVAAKATTNASLQLCDWSWASEVLRSQTGPGFDCLIVEQGSVKCHWMPNSRNPWHEH